MWVVKKALYVLGCVQSVCHDYVQITPKSWAYTGEKGRAPEEPTAQQLIYPGFPIHDRSFERCPSSDADGALLCLCSFNQRNQLTRPQKGKK